jgi:hypothetical protein
MSPATSQQWTRRIRYSDQHIRVSDAERNSVTELLGQHYADGRLDQAEFDDRIDRTMAAKTRGDLAGLFDDLPRLEAEPTPRPPRRRRLIPFLLLVVLVIAAAGSSIWWVHLPWLLIGLAALFFWSRSGRFHHHHHHRQSVGGSDHQVIG